VFLSVSENPGYDTVQHETLRFRLTYALGLPIPDYNTIPVICISCVFSVLIVVFVHFLVMDMRVENGLYLH